MSTCSIPGRRAVVVAIALAAAVTGCASNNGNGDSVTPNGVTSEPAGPTPEAGR